MKNFILQHFADYHKRFDHKKNIYTINAAKKDQSLIYLTAQAQEH